MFFNADSNWFLNVDIYPIPQNVLLKKQDFWSLRVFQSKCSGMEDLEDP